MNVEHAIHKRITQLCQEKNISLDILPTTGDNTKETTFDTIEALCSVFNITIADFFNSELFRSIDHN